MANIFEQAKQVMQMRKEAKRIQAEIERIVVTYANAGVEVSMRGDFTVTSVKVAPEVIEELKSTGKTDRFTTMLQNVINGALKQAKDTTQQHMQKLMKEQGGLGGLGSLLGQ